MIIGLGKAHTSAPVINYMGAVWAINQPEELRHTTGGAPVPTASDQLTKYIMKQTLMHKHRSQKPPFVICSTPMVCSYTTPQT